MARLTENQEEIAVGTADGFYLMYWKKLSTSYSERQAYERVEKIHEKHFGRKRYASWDSFRVLKNRRLKNEQ